MPEVLQALPGYCARRRGRHTTTVSRRSREFDGHVPAAGKVLDPCAIPHGVSATALEQAAGCGFQHFLKRGLRLDAVGDGEKDGDVWLDPLIRGAELHDLYAATLRRSRDERRRPDRERDLHMAARASRRRGSRRCVLRCHRRQTRCSIARAATFSPIWSCFSTRNAPTPRSAQAVGLEVAFGRTYGGDDAQSEPLASAEPIEIDLGGGLKFRLTGRIDRIDQVAPSTFEIIDYKTGGYWADDVGNRDLQRRHAATARALWIGSAGTTQARPQETGRVRRRLLLLQRERGQGAARHRCAGNSAIANVLSDLRQMIASGAFIHTGDHDVCKFCDFARACGAPVAVTLVEAKLQDKKLAPRVRLADT